ncbi:kinesin-like protein KIN-14J [Corylus avellana]|uniref:kinesin-like protein KIN-14J n=1 Tax=Corylus avellana TaxID=13451 RepID=UPI00286BECB3|nr:kinesin-like protein KIN-14J [Corylus avellana]
MRRLSTCSFSRSMLSGGNVGQHFTEDIELLGFEDADSEEGLSDISDGGLSMGTETDGSIGSVVEYTLFPEVAKPAENIVPERTPAEKPPIQNSGKQLTKNLACASSKRNVTNYIFIS